MKLLYSPTSPYARKVRMVAIARGLDGQIEDVPTSPFDDRARLAPINPLGKIPALITDDGAAIHDSAVICDYLDTLGDAPSLWPDAGDELWTAKTRASVADGIMDAAFALVMERKRPEAERSAMWMDAWTSAIIRAAGAVNGQVSTFHGRMRVDTIALACALGYVDFRLNDLGWRDGNARLAMWFDRVSTDPAMIATAPPAG